MLHGNLLSDRNTTSFINYYLLIYVADNLAWKLSDVLKNLPKDPEKLLDSYGLEVGYQ